MEKQKNSKPWYKRVWVWISIIVVIGIIGSAMSPETKNTNTNNATNNTPQATETPKETPKAQKWDMEAAYAKISNGMTKAQVEEAVGKAPESCTESQSEYIGKTELCTYGSIVIDKAAITVTFSQDEVSSKGKSTY